MLNPNRRCLMTFKWKEITQERLDLIAMAMHHIVIDMNAIKHDEIRKILYDLGHDETIMPLTDPTRYMGMAKPMQKTKDVLNAILTFKVAVAGIGDFEEVPDAD